MKDWSATPRLRIPRVPGLEMNMASALRWASAYIEANKGSIKPAGDGEILEHYRVALDVQLQGSFWTAMAEPERIFTRAKKGERLARQACLEMAAAYIRRGRPVHPLLAEFAADALDASARASGKRRGRDPRANELRDLLIANIIADLEADFGIDPTRNQATKEKGGRESGCAIVARLLTKAGVDLRERAVEDVWAKIRAEHINPK